MRCFRRGFIRSRNRTTSTRHARSSSNSCFMREVRNRFGSLVSNTTSTSLSSCACPQRKRPENAQRTQAVLGLTAFLEHLEPGKDIVRGQYRRIHIRTSTDDPSPPQSLSFKLRPDHPAIASIPSQVQQARRCSPHASGFDLGQTTFVPMPWATFSR